MRRRYVPILVFAVLTAGLLLARSTAAVLVLLTDGLVPLAVIVAAAGLGAWPVAWLGLEREQPLRRFCIAVATGFGVLAWFALSLGCLGWLSAGTAWAIVIVGGVAGLTRIYLDQHNLAGEAAAQKSRSEDAAASPLLADVGWDVAAFAVLVIPAAIVLFGATLPPGMIWGGEARGYDALEYHLQVPREWFNAGHIFFLPHNAYASFPQQVESLYLLLMHLLGGPYVAAVPAQLLHAGFAVLTVLALVAWSPAGAARRIVLLLAGATPWLAYLGVLAYVECGMLFFAAVAAGLLLETLERDRALYSRTIAVAGLCAGLAGGCKYTAIALVVVALGVAWGLVAKASVADRLRSLAIYFGVALVALCPWLIRNAAFTGNPVYPFAYSIFGGAGWSAEQDEQWQRGHHLPPNEASLSGRFRIAARELFGDLTRSSPSLFGVGLALLGVIGLVASRSRVAAMAAVWALLILAMWMTLTHMPGRFAVPLVLPLAWLGSRHVARRGPTAAAILSVLAIASGVMGSVQLWRLLAAEAREWRIQAGLRLADAPGLTQAFRDGRPLNRVLPADAYAWLIGDAAVFYDDRRIHYTVAFSRDPWLAYAGDHSPSECVAWLAKRGVTHVAFDWREIERLRATYGFDPIVTPAWVEGLAAAGLRPVKSDELPPGLAVYGVGNSE